MKFIAATVLLFEIVFMLVGSSYRQINSKLKSHAASKRFIMTAQKKRSVRGTIAYKEFKRMTGSANYLVNMGLGELLCLILGIAALFIDFDSICLCAFSTAWGCVCGIKHMRLDWENEIEVIKQSSAVAIYMFPNMFINMGLIVLTVYLGTKMNHNLIMGILIAAVSVLAGLSYKKAVSFT